MKPLQKLLQEYKKPLPLTPEEVEAKQHDRAVSTLDTLTLEAIVADLGKRNAHNRRDPEQRWVMSRRAAALRALQGRRAA